VTLNATVDARSLDTDVRFEYGPTGAYGAQTAAQRLADPSARPVRTALTNLQPATTYHYRLVAASGGGSVQSPDRTFTTSAAPPPPPPPPVPAPPPPPPPPPVSAPPPACSNGRDDDRDGFADIADPRCHADADPRNAGSYQPQGASESRVDTPRSCAARAAWRSSALSSQAYAGVSGCAASPTPARPVSGPGSTPAHGG
jgi:hypothetical protein